MTAAAASIFHHSDEGSEASADAAAGGRGSNGGNGGNGGNGNSSSGGSGESSSSSGAVTFQAGRPVVMAGTSRAETEQAYKDDDGEKQQEEEEEEDDDGSVDEDGDEFYDAAATPQGARAEADVVAGAATAAKAYSDKGVAARAAAATRSGAGRGGRGSAAGRGLRFSSRGRAMMDRQQQQQRPSGRDGGGGGGVDGAERRPHGVTGRASPPPAASSPPSESSGPTVTSSPPTYDSVAHSRSSGGAAGVADETTELAARECRERAIEAATAAAGEAVASGERKTEAQLMAAGAAAAAKATRGRLVPDDVRRRAIQAGAQAAAAAGAGDGGGGARAVAVKTAAAVTDSRWSMGSEVKSALKSAGSFRVGEKPRSVSFADASSGDYDSRRDLDEDDYPSGGGMRALRQVGAVFFVFCGCLERLLGFGRGVVEEIRLYGCECFVAAPFFFERSALFRLFIPRAANRPTQWR